MNKLEDVPGVCKLLDYGVTSEAAYLVMPKYQGSMREWRLQQPQDADGSMERVYLQVFWLATNIVEVEFVPVPLFIQCLHDAVLCALPAVHMRQASMSYCILRSGLVVKVMYCTRALLCNILVWVQNFCC